MEKEKIVTPENSIYIDGLRLGRRLLFYAEELDMVWDKCYRSSSGTEKGDQKSHG